MLLDFSENKKFRKKKTGKPDQNERQLTSPLNNSSFLHALLHTWFPSLTGSLTGTRCPPPAHGNRRRFNYKQENDGGPAGVQMSRRQSGQEACLTSQRSMQGVWKTCRHSGSRLADSPTCMSCRHTEQQSASPAASTAVSAATLISGSRRSA